MSQRMVPNNWWLTCRAADSVMPSADRNASKVSQSSRKASPAPPAPAGFGRLLKAHSCRCMISVNHPGTL